MHDHAHDARPRRPFFTPLKMIAIALLLGGALFAWFVLSVIFADPNITTDYGTKANELARQRQKMPAGAPDNWGLISEIAEKLSAAREAVAQRHPDVAPDAFDFTFLYTPDAKPYRDSFTAEQARQICREWLEEFRAAGGFDDLAKLPEIAFAARPYAQDTPLVLILLPELGHARQLARMNAARMKLASDAGDEATRLAAFEQMLASARVIGAQLALIDNLVAVAINALAASELRREIIERPLSERAALDLLAAMDRHPLPSVAGAFDGERYMTLDMIQRTYSDNGRGDGRFLPAAAADLDVMSTPQGTPGAGTSRVFNLMGLLQPGRAETVERANQIYDYYIKLASMTRPERAALTGPDPAANIGRFKILSLMLPAVGKALESNDQITSELAATRIMLALEVHRARHNAYPATLAELAPAILPALPIDAANGKGFGYRLLDPATDPDNRGYLLYSFGADGVDNGGDMGAKPPVTALRATGGLDFVYNQPRATPEASEAEAAPTQENGSSDAGDGAATAP